MNTPAHMALSLAVLGRERRRGAWAVILAGGLLPDLFLFLEHFTGRGPLTAQLVIVFNSAVLYAALAALGLALRLWWLPLLALSALLHIALDLPLHATDARAHFWPLTDWTFASPFSFWDTGHHGALIGTLEGVLFALCLVIVWRRCETWAQRALAALGGLVYAAAFVHFAGHAFAGQHWAIW
ncbi:hypothetical protein OG2516_09680 [Oceanicola granulosus HTCC2516]|uniref:Membrane-bound metal-dependent hydrolase n=1 Tax=Oceanicola granulosus (strain ATCC BAA-861 / DSM 15982 / KCTC 12143 / HTCC2516) TaxID=314256 RepID=Q2CCW8_OCEGH|nr:hypothetical protein [Oceanicola granulosus]EAR50505.1 hypothetical protein OG2516_09680 [Oceanicola granulosus HTCC2516]